ncbi:MAG: hypothetical protein VB064_01380 [Oscillospiraceae bacterium]|nr:hypothetical protein [Oscillospiraceae bacterium]
MNRFYPRGKELSPTVPASLSIIAKDRFVAGLLLIKRKKPREKSHGWTYAMVYRHKACR